MTKKTTNPSQQPELLYDDQASNQATPEEQKEKEAYRQRLRAYLHDPEFRKIEGFPIGEDEDILALSDPPYYTACPNPFLGEIIEKWQEERAELRKELGLPDDNQDNGNGLKVYHREPFATDVSEGKNDPIYNAHSYHTKVPHKAIMRYILHYTDPGDIVMDGFCGTGMTGVAAQLSGDKKTVESLGIAVQRDGTIVNDKGEPISKLGVRRAVLVDLSPAATFIAYNYNTQVDAKVFEKEARRILKEVEVECGWMNETWHPNSNDPDRVKGKIKYTVWSDVFVCPQCGTENIFWDVAVDHVQASIRNAWNCPGCDTLLAKNPHKGSGAIRAERAFETRFDSSINQSVRQAKQIPVLIYYSTNKQRYEKKPDSEDLALIKKIEESNIPYTFSTRIIPKGDKTTDPFNLGITHVHYFYTRRNLWILSAVRSKSQSVPNVSDNLIFLLTSSLPRTSKLYKFTLDRKMGTVSGTLYIPSLWTENSPFKLLQQKIGIMSQCFRNVKTNLLSTTSAGNIQGVPDSTIDYVFVDPPFGSNLMYSELNFIWEAWLRIFTNKHPEAVVNKTQRKGLPDYQRLMETCFAEFHRLLKPGRWITVEFHNSQNAVWNAIQEALLRVGFVVADVRTFDKQQGTFNQVTASGSVKQDLIISAYRPRTEFEHQFLTEGGSLKGAWAFINQHLEQLPIPSVVNDVVEMLTERQNYLLYDRMIAFHIMHGLSVPLSAAEFYQGLTQRFLERDGMYFTSGQASEYDKRRLGAQKVEQLSLFVTDEKSAIQWLQRELDQAIGTGPQTYQDLQPKFLRELHQARYEALPELRVMLEDNFLQEPGGRWYVPNPEKQADLEALRQRSLLREFNEYLQSKGRLKVFRSEAVRAGFSYYWKERDYDTIMKVADRLPSNVLEEDQQLLMYVHNAGLRQQGQPKQERLL